MNSPSSHGFVQAATCIACGSYSYDCGCDGHDDAPDVFEGSHAEFAASESYISPTEKRWVAWVASVEGLLGRNLDGDEGDGFSLDSADAAFDADLTPAEYVAEVRA